MQISDSRSVISSNFYLKNLIFTNFNANVNGGVLSCTSEQGSCSIKDCFFILCKTSSDEGGVLYITKGNKHEVRCCLFRKNSAVYSPNFWISDRSTPFKNNLENIATCQSETEHLDIFGGNPLLYKHSNCTNNNENLGYVVDYFIAEKHNQFSYINVANNNFGASYFSHDQEKMPENIYFDKINFVNNIATNFFYPNMFKKYDQFFETNFIETSQVPAFNEPVSFHNSYFCFSLTEANKKSATIVSAVSLPINIIISIDCRIKCTVQHKQHKPAYIIFFIINVFLS